MTSATPKPRAGEHTKGPWEAVPHRSGTQIRSDSLVVCSGLSEANTRRIVACVNALEGMPIEGLEGKAREMLHNYAAFISLKSERDGLKEGLELLKNELQEVQTSERDSLEILERILPLAESYLAGAPGHPDNAKLEDARVLLAKHGR